LSFNPAELVEELKQLSSSLTFWFWSGKIFAQKPKHLKEEKYSFSSSFYSFNKKKF
jgi:hypothetical protein